MLPTLVSTRSGKTDSLTAILRGKMELLKETLITAGWYVVFSFVLILALPERTVLKYAVAIHVVSVVFAVIMCRALEVWSNS